MKLKIHIVQKDETLWKIAQKYGVSLDELIANNTHISNPDQIMPGMKIKIPYTKHSHSDKSNKKEKKHKPKQTTMPPVQEDEQINYAPLEKEMPALPMHFYPQTQPQLPSQSLPNISHEDDWDKMEYEKETSYPKAMDGQYKGEKHHMKPQQMHPMPYPAPQSPSMEHSQHVPSPCHQPQHMPHFHGMHHAPAGCQPNHFHMGSGQHPYSNHMAPYGYGNPQAPMQQPMMPNNVAGAQQMMPNYAAGAQQMMPPPGMNPGMSPPGMQQYQQPAYSSPYHQQNFGDCGCGGPREEE